MKNTDLLDVKLNVLDSSVRILTNHTRLHFFTGTSEVLCRAVLLDKEEIGPGESGYVQLRMEEEVAVRRGDKFVVRFYSPMETIGGGVVLEPNPKIKRRFQPEVIEELKRKEEGSSADVIEMHVKSHAETLITVTELAAYGTFAGRGGAGCERIGRAGQYLCISNAERYVCMAQRFCKRGRTYPAESFEGI